MRFKSALCLLLAVCFLAASSLPVFAENDAPAQPSTLEELLANLPEDEEVFQAELSRLGIVCTSHEMPQQDVLTRASVVDGPITGLAISGGVAICSGDVVGDSSTTDVVIYLYLKKFENGNFEKKYSNHKTFTGRYGYYEYSRSLSTYGSGPYRVDGSYYLFTGGKYINPEINSSVVYY